MSTYAIGDIQGCHTELLQLLEHIDFDPASDRLWFTGDLVNRGPDSAAVLRTVRDLGGAAVAVLGNHDIHLLAVALAGAPLNASDTLDCVLRAPDADALLEWLRRRPLLHRDRRLGFIMVHAGLAPQWTADEAEARAREVEAALSGPEPRRFLRSLYGNKPLRWKRGLEGADRLRFITNCLTRMRYCDAEGRLQLKAKGPPGSQPEGLLPWYEVPGRRSTDTRVVFGHWSTHHLSRPDTAQHGVYGIDTGCLWGGSLSALELESLQLHQVPGRRRPARA